MMRRSRRISYLTQSYETNSGQEKGDLYCGGDTPTSPGKGFALATPSRLSSIRCPRLW